MGPTTKRVIYLVAVATVAFGAYFINVEYQSSLGRTAVAATGLESLPLDQALVRARSTARPVLVEVAAIWCPTCRALDQRVFANREVGAFVRDHLVFSRLEYESTAGQTFLRDHHEQGFPRLWLLDSDGQVIRKLELTFDPGSFLKQLVSRSGVESPNTGI